MRNNGIRNIIFDLGVVLLDLDFEAPAAAFRRLSRHGQVGDVREFIHHPVFTGFETGTLTPGQFRERLRQLLGNPDATDAELDGAWCSILGKVPGEKVRLLKDLSGHYRLFLYSNTNAIHIPVFERAFEREHSIVWDSLFSRVFYSHEICDRKPNLSGYRKVLAMAEANPAQTLFIDDLEQNTSAASLAGMSVLHYVHGADLGKEIHKRLNLQ